MATAQAPDTMAPGMNITKRQFLDSLRVQLDNEFSTHRPALLEIANYINPERLRFFATDTNKGQRKNQYIIDSTASTSGRTLSAGMMGGLTSPAREWFKLGVKDTGLNEDPDIKQWLDNVTEILTHTFNGSNLYQSLPEIYNDAADFATACMLAEEDMDTVIHFTTFPIGSFRIANDAKGRVAVFFREFRLTVRQVVEKFQKAPGDWSNISNTVKMAWETGKLDAWIDIYHAIYPNPEFDPSKSHSKFKKFASTYYEKGTASGDGVDQNYMTGDPKMMNTYLRESGYDKFRVMAPRWQLSSGDAYGTKSPGRMCIGDVKQLQLGEKRLAQAIDKVLDPPMKGPEGMKSYPASSLPGGMTWTTEVQGGGKFEPVYQVDPRLAEMETKQEQVRARIKRVYFEDIFMMISQDERTQPPTAEEIIEKRGEKMLALGPVVEQFNQDLLNPLIDITFDMLLRQGKIPPVPQKLQGQEIKVNFVSIMAQAQRVLGIANVERFAGFVIKMAMETQDVSVLDTFNKVVMIRDYGTSLGIEQKMLSTDKEIAAAGQQRQQAQQASQQAEIAQQTATAAQKLSQTDMSKDSALRRLVGTGNADQSPPVQ